MAVAAELSNLTPREREILALIGEGYSLPEIAQRLHRSVKTIETHRLTLGKKLSATNRVELARIAISTGLVKLNVQHEHQAQTKRNGLIGDGDDALLAHLAQLDQAIGPATGAEYLRQLACALPAQLGVDYAGISESVEIDGQMYARVLTVSDKGLMADTMLCSFQDTPCYEAFKGGEYLRLHGVIDAYPNVMEFRKLNADSYLGVRLDGPTGLPIGIVWVMHTRAIENPKLVSRVLKFCANRCAGELSRTVDMMQELESLERREQLKTNMDLDELLVHRSNARLDSLLNVFHDFAGKMHDGLFVLDDDLIIRHTNPALLELLGYQADELIGQPVNILFTEDALHSYKTEHVNACDLGEALNLRMVGRHHDGHTLPLAVARTGLFDVDGKVAGTLALIAADD